MKRYLCCFKGEGSGTAVEGSGTAAVQEPQPPVIRENTVSIFDQFPSTPPLPANRPVSFSWQAIVDGTQNFRETLSIGRGNFGKVYRCELPNIKKVGAAKIQASTNQTTHLEFIAEVTMLHEADHPNVIKLLGQCYESTHRALIYEFMPNGSLDHYLVDPSSGLPQSSVVLDWETRMRIAVGVAKGLAYIHTALKAVHRDIKAGNILLDQNFEPKLSDFGLATRILEGEVIKGTFGCIAPETFGKFSTKSDVYSYGVLLLQLCTGKKTFDWERPDTTRHLPDLFLTDLYTDLVADVALCNKFSVDGFRKVLNTAWVCVNADPHSRPDMNVVETLIVEAAACPIRDDSTASSSTYQICSSDLV